MTEFYTVTSTNETEELGKELAKRLDSNGLRRAFIAMRGEMGVGKTAFTRGFASYFGILCVKSPTYTVLNEYRGRAKIHHFDFYRITDGDDLYSIGYDDIIESDGYCIGEWSENVEDFLPAERITVTISRINNENEANANLRNICIDLGDLL